MDLSKKTGMGNPSESQGDAEAVDVYPYKCNFCTRKFKYNSQKANHERAHSEIRQFACEICGKAYKQRGGLVAHMDIHNGETIKCTQCCFETKRKGGLRNHMVRESHQCKHAIGKCPQQLELLRPVSKTKLFECLLCGAKFYHLNSLRMHYNIIHAEEKKKQKKLWKVPKSKKSFMEACHICDNGKKFKSKGGLNRHMKVHSNVKPYKCHICNMEFRERFNFRRHVERHGNSAKSSEQGVSARAQNCSELGASEGG